MNQNRDDEAMLAKVEELDGVFIFDHPLIQDKISKLRNKNTSSKEFRELAFEVSLLMAYEATRDLALEEVEIETPIAPCKGYQISGKALALVPILRAGLGMLDPWLSIVPNAKVGHLGVYRDQDTKEAVEYYCKLPTDIAERDVYLLDPMLATGVSAISCLNVLKKYGVKQVRFVCLLAARPGVLALHRAHPQVPIYCAALDDFLNEDAYIVPGLGDAGDRLFGTK